MFSMVVKIKLSKYCIYEREHGISPRKLQTIFSGQYPARRRTRAHITKTWSSRQGTSTDDILVSPSKHTTAGAQVSNQQPLAGDLGVANRDGALVVLLDGVVVVVAVDLLLHGSDGTLGLVLVLEDYGGSAGVSNQIGTWKTYGKPTPLECGRGSRGRRSRQTRTRRRSKHSFWSG